MAHEDAQSPEVLLPLTPAVFHILLTLADGEKHGYAIMREVGARSAGTVRMGPGTLYGSLRRMLDDGLIVEMRDRLDPDRAEERRRYYDLTDFGRRVLQAEAHRLEQLVRIAQSKHVLPGFGSVGGV